MSLTLYMLIEDELLKHIDNYLKNKNDETKIDEIVEKILNEIKDYKPIEKVIAIFKLLFIFHKIYVEKMLKLKEDIEYDKIIVKTDDKIIFEIPKSDTFNISVLLAKLKFQKPKEEFWYIYKMKGDKLILDKSSTFALNHINPDTIIKIYSSILENFYFKILNMEKYNFDEINRSYEYFLTNEISAFYKISGKSIYDFALLVSLLLSAFVERYIDEMSDEDFKNFQYNFYLK